MKTPRAWIESLPKREPPYDEFLDRHPVILWALIVSFAALALLMAVAFVGMAVR